MTREQVEVIRDLVIALSASCLDHDATAALDAMGEAKRKLTTPEMRREAFLTIAPGVKLVRFGGADKTVLMARRVGTCGNKNALFCIEVFKDFHCATVKRDDRELFTVSGDGISSPAMIEELAISALKRYMKRRIADHRRQRARRRGKGEK